MRKVSNCTFYSASLSGTSSCRSFGLYLSMQKSLFILLLIFSGFGLSAQIRSNRDLVGKWQGNNMKLEFFSDQHVIMTLPGGRLPVATFTADYMHNPVLLMITVMDNGQKLSYKGNLQFLDNENIQLEYFAGNSNNVFEKGRVVKLKRLK